MKKLIIIINLSLFLLFVFASCSQDKDIEPIGTIPEDLPTLDVVTLKTELEYYAEGTARILAFWENDSEFPLTYGRLWQLEKYDNKKDKWTIVWKSDSSMAVESIGYSLLPEWRRKHTYYITRFDENISEGFYRIKTYFLRDDEMEKDVEDRQYGITAEFTVTKDKSLVQKSELDFDDLENSEEINIMYECYDFLNMFTFANFTDFPVHVYRNEKTYDTTIVINGDEYYEIAEGNGKWGIVMCSFYRAYDDGKFLVYSYSREDNGKKQSYIGIFDLVAKKEIYRSDAYETYDISINYRREAITNKYGEVDIFEARFMEYEDAGANQSSAPGEIGYFKYENGMFNFYKDE